MINTETAPATPRFNYLTRLINRARQTEAEGNSHTAIRLYFQLMEEHFGAPEAAQARECLLGMARQYEDDGLHHQADDLFNRLMSFDKWAEEIEAA
ncbi:MAG: hypothetical protein H8E20_14135 [Verrucomicrobia bacterium]|nr:hypothetical protein [Verrucomicrobiota bacterium]